MSIIDLVNDARNEGELHWAQVKLTMIGDKLQDKSKRRIEQAIADRRKFLLTHPQPQRPVPVLPDTGFVPQEYPEIEEQQDEVS